MADLDALTFKDAAQIPLARATHWLAYINDAMRRYDIVTPQQQAAFIAQTCHESGHYTRWIENLNYTTPERILAIFSSHFKNFEQARRLDEARKFVRNPAELATLVYSNRLGNGGPGSGDALRYIGRAWIQITGKDNYRAAGIGLNLPLLEQPELLELEEHAAEASAWWWSDHNLNYWADQENIDAISGIISRGDPKKKAVGQVERREGFEHAVSVLMAGV